MPTILIVDDISENLYMLEVLLTGYGYSVTTAMNGQEALASAAASPPDIIVSDILMPVMDGYALCREWKAHERLKSIPFVFYTATFTEPKDEELALSLGADRFVIKPQEPDVLLHMISDVLAEYQNPATAPANNDRQGHDESFKGYSEALFRKLEKKMADLEQTKINLEHEVGERTRAENELLAMNQTLEERITERMIELRATVDALQQEVTQRKQAQEEIDWLNQDLVLQKKALETANKELESFSYSVSHDLRAPLRQICGYIRMLNEEFDATLEEPVKLYLRNIDRLSIKMGDLIEGLLQLSRVSRGKLRIERIDLSAMATEIAAFLQQTAPERTVSWLVQQNITGHADNILVRIVLENLLGNAWKYTAKREPAVIEFGLETRDNDVVYFVRDNGVGFDMQYAGKLFEAFQRLHKSEEYEGTGIGLATVQRIIHRHNGSIWADACPDKGATIFFTLPVQS